MSATTERMTVEEYYEITVEGDRKQLVGGAIVVNDPAFTHAKIQGRLFGALFTWIGETGRGVALFLLTDVRLSEHDLYGPDLVWLEDEHPPLNERDKLAGVPNNPRRLRFARRARGDTTSVRRGSDTRAAGYPSCGSSTTRVSACWFTAGRRRTRRRSTSELELDVGDELTSPQLPGFALSLEELFRR